MVYAASNAVTAGVAFLLLPLLTHFLTPEEYGRVALFALCLTIASAVVGLNSHAALTVRHFQSDRFDMAPYVTGCMLILMASGIVFILVVAIFRSQLEDYTELPLRWLLLSVFAAGCLFIINVRLTLWQASGQPYAYASLRGVQSLSDAAISVGAVSILMAGWQGRTSGQVIALLICALLALMSLGRQGLLSVRPRLNYMINALRYGAPLVPHVLGGAMLMMIDRLIIANLLGVASTGIYMVALQIGMMLTLLTDSVNKAYAPWLIGALNKIDRDRDARIVVFTYLYWFGIFIIALSLSAVMYVALPWFVGDEFESARSLIFYVSIGASFIGMYYTVTNFIFFAEKTEILAMSTLATALFSAALSYALVSRYGLVGAAQAFMCSQFALFGVTWIAASIVHPMPWLSALRGGRPRAVLASLVTSVRRFQAGRS